MINMSKKQKKVISKIVMPTNKAKLECAEMGIDTNSNGFYVKGFAILTTKDKKNILIHADIYYKLDELAKKENKKLTDYTNKEIEDMITMLRL